MSWLEIFGAAHLAAYALVGFSIAFAFFVNWSAREFKLKADMIRIYKRILQERHERKNPTIQKIADDLANGRTESQQ